MEDKMTTASVDADVVDAEFAANFKKVLDGLLGLRGISDKELILMTGIKRSTFFRKCKDGTWTGREIQKLAHALECDEQVFYTKADDLVPKQIADLMTGFHAEPVAA